MARRTLGFVCSGAAVLVALSACGENLTPPDRRMTTGDPTVLECLPNLDGKLESTEMIAAVGVPASFLISPPGVEREISLVATVDDEGRKVWDQGVDYADDEVLTVAVSEPLETWWAPEFPEAEFAIPLDAAGDTLGIYRQDDEALWLLGSVSSEETPPQGKTMLRYDQPVAVLRFPIEPGREWVSEATIEHGTLYGLPFVATHQYTVRVADSGRLVLPQLTIEQAHLVHTKLVVTPVVGGGSTVRQSRFLSECLGEVARFESRQGEANEEFSIAAEVRRLGLGL